MNRRIDRILNALTKAASGDYSAKLRLASKDDELDRVADAVNALLGKLNKQSPASSQPLDHSAIDASRYRNIIESLDEAYIETDLKGHITFLNEKLVLDIGYEKKELQGLSFSKLMDAETAKKAYAVYHDVFVTGRPVKGFEYALTKKSREKIDAEISIWLLRDEHGKPTGFGTIVRNISKRKEAERALQHSEERYRKLLEDMEETYVEQDLQGNYVFVNNFFCRALGYSREEILNSNYRLVIPPGDRPSAFQAFNEIYRTGNPKHFNKLPVRHKDGSIRFLEFWIALLRSPSGEPIGFGGVGRDVTEKLKAEQKLRESEEKYRTILQNMEDCYVEANLQGNYEFFNDALCRLLGYSREELMNISYKEIDSPETQQRIRQEYSEVYRTGQTKHFIPGTYKTKDGRIRHAEMTVSLRRSPAGEPIGFATITRDITEQLEAQEKLRQSEEKYRNILESIEESYHETDLEGNYIFVNDALCRILGYSREELLNINYKQIDMPEYHEKILTEAAAIYRTGNAKTFFAHPVKCKDGSTKFLESTVSLRRSSAGEPMGLAIVSRDITEKLQAEQKLKESEEKYRGLLEDMEETYVEMDLKGNYTFFNDALCRVLGYSRGELQNMNYKQINPPEDNKINFEAFNEVYRTGKPNYHFVNRVKCKDGSIRYREHSIALRRSPEAEPIGFRLVSRDVTEKLQAERKLKESEGKYRNILESMEESYLETDLRGHYVFFNDALCRVLGYSREELQNLNYKRINLPEDYQRVAEEFNKVYRTGRPSHSFYSRVLCKDGSIKHRENSIALRRSPEGEPIGFALVSKDLTERLRAEQKIKESEEKYRNILENMQETYLETDLKGNYIFFNNSLCQLLGYSREELQGISYKKIDPPGRHEKIIDEYKDIFRTGKTKTFIANRLVCKDGSIKHMESTVSLLRSPQGEPIGFATVGRDITERLKAEENLRQSEEKYRSILENMQEAYLETDLRGQYVFFNDSFCRILGYAPEELLNVDYNKMTPSEDHEAITEEFRKVHRTGQPSFFMDNRVLCKDGSIKHMEFSLALRRLPAGDPIGFSLVGRDITEKLKAEQKITESERHLRLLTDNISDIIWTMDFNLQWNYISPSVFRLTGFKPEEVMQIPLKAIASPDTYQLAQQAVSEGLAREAREDHPQERRVVTSEVQLQRKDGSRFWTEISATFNRDENGKPFEIVGVTRNITERKHAEEALRESEKRYRMIVENMHDSIGLLDLDFNYIYLSPSAVRITGYDPAEHLKIPTKDHMTPESYSLLVNALAEELQREFSGGPVDTRRVRTVEIEVYHKKGHTVWVELTAAFNRDASGKPVGIMVASRDVTERRKIREDLRMSENRYRTIVENMQDSITLLDLDLNCLYVSPSEVGITGYTPEELMEIPTKNQLTPESFAIAEKILVEELEREFSDEPVDPHRSRTVDVEVYHKKGGTVWTELTVSFNRDENGKPIGLILASRDITARRKAEEEKDKLEKQLIQAQKMETVGRLAGGVAHDFNNMLSVILGYVEISKLRLDRENPLLRDLAEIEKAALRSRDIITQLLAFSRKQIIAPKIVDLNDLVSRTQKALNRLIGEDIHLSYHPGKELWAIKFDPSQIEQILFNLAVNARDAMPEGGKLTIETCNKTLDDFYCESHLGFKPGDFVRLTVSDNGTGMDKETLQYIFEPFFTTKEAGRGTGLGLATVYGIVKQNEGFINVYSEPGQGTTFSIYLPRTAEETEAQEESHEEQMLTGSGNILLVEDDPMVLAIAKEMLESIGYAVRVAADPLDALAICERDQAIDMVLTDVVMPIMNGKELKKRLLGIRPDIKVLFMSGYTANTIAHHGVLEEGVDFLAKPFTMKDLASKVRQVMGAK